MTLEKFLQIRDMKPSAFAKAIGVPPSTITRALKGERTLGMDVMDRIARATGGEVMPNDFLPFRPEEEATQAPATHGVTQ